MKRKHLVLLLLLPLMVLATDKVLGSIGPRNAPKKGIKTESVLTNGGGTELDARALQKVKRYMRDISSQGMDMDNLVWSGDDRVTDEVRSFLDKRMMPVVDKILIGPEDVDMLLTISRCPSGYFYVLEQDENERLTQTGRIGNHEGCWETTVGRFAYDIEAKTVKMILPDNLGYMPLKSYLEMYAEVAG